MAESTQLPSRREALAAIVGGAVSGQVPAAAGPAGPAGPVKPVKPAESLESRTERIARKCRYYHEPLRCHPAVPRAVLALVLLDQALDMAWGEYQDIPELRCPCCSGQYETMMMIEKPAQLLRQMLTCSVYGGEEACVALAPSIIPNYLNDLAVDFGADLRAMQKAGELPHADAWAEPLADADERGAV